MLDQNNFRIREANLNDAERLLEIYKYYVENTAITYEYDVPSIEEFSGRIKTIRENFPYLVVEEIKEKSLDDNMSEHGFMEAGNSEESRIVGYAYASKFHERAAYQWSAEMSIYLDKDSKRGGLGRMLYEELEKRLKDQGILNLYACIGYPDQEDEYLTFDSVKFHEKMGYSLIGKFSKCGKKFGRWYNMVWMEKIIGEHRNDPAPI